MLEEIAQQITQYIKDTTTVHVCEKDNPSTALALQSFFHEPKTLAQINVFGIPQYDLVNLAPERCKSPDKSNDADIDEMPITFKLVIKLYSFSAEELETATDSLLDAFNKDSGFRFALSSNDHFFSYPTKLSRYSDPIKEGSQYVLLLGYDSSVEEATVPIRYSDILPSPLSVAAYAKNELVCFCVYYLILMLNPSHPNLKVIERRLQEIKLVLGSVLSSTLESFFSSEGLADYSDYFQLKNA